MIRYMFGKLGVGSQTKDEEFEDDLDDEDEAKDGVGYLRTGIGVLKENHSLPPSNFINSKFDKSSSVVESKNGKDKNGVIKDDHPEVVSSRGIITALDESMPKGIIDRTYQFDIQKFCSNRNHGFKFGSEVEFVAVRSKQFPAWTVTIMKNYVSEKEQEIKERLRIKSLITQVTRIDQDNIEVRWGNENSTQLIPNVQEIMPAHSLRIGDWLKVSLEQIYEDECEGSNGTEDLNYGEKLGNVISVEPTQQKIIVGKVTILRGELCIDDKIYFTIADVKGGRNPPAGSLVQCHAVEWSQKNFEPFTWRAVAVSPSNFMQYTADAHNRDEDGYFEEQNKDDEVNLRITELYQDRYGIRIKPGKVWFKAIKIGDSAARSVTVTNTSEATFVLQKISFNRDQSVCRFEVEYPTNKEKDCVVTLGPQDSYSFLVHCTPLMMGRTKELCVFDFTSELCEFKIARDFSVTGLAENEDIVSQIKKPDETHYRPNYHKFRGEQDIGRIMNDQNRIRVRGSQPVRAPFFLPKRIPHYKVPNEIWEAFRQQNEGLVKSKFPGAIQQLDFWNYQEKFRVSLWFEEVENDLRRRQYDVHNARLKRVGENFMFTAQGVQDYQPPVLVGDPIDVFDPDDPNRVKYQGYIKKIVMWEVHAMFSEVFNQTYTGVPVTVQFCLGRMTYKRQHYAVDGAQLLLGEKFLFPKSTFEVKEPRIPFYEDNVEEDVTEESVPDPEKIPQKNEENDYVPELGLFRKPQEKSANSQKTKSSGDRTNERAQSLRTPFMSNVSTTTFTSEVKLKWFNKGLNDEQKDAVRRILRGQARPLPYIIYGPPGTGKTVTVVEAIMQVNKLDPNSRVLVTAPTNHAADVISECLVNSKQYHPGDFVRFNGFMRQEQVMIDGIKEFCVDGEFLDSVARNRLIISTCTTAGQFFSLNLTPGHFTHVFIDEAGYCTEPEAVIAAVHLAIDKGGQLILAGDPNQLGPVLMSDVAQNLDLNLSLLERLMKGKTGIPNLYARDPEKEGTNCGYNPLVLTKLIKNYRAHPSLLKLPSRLFYNDDLVSCASFEEAYELTQNPKITEKILRSQGVPLVFHGVQGTCVREKDSPSWCNAAEVMQVVDYVRKLKLCGLKNEDIGIITPYRKQAEKLRIALQLGLLEDDIPKVGSVEEFQGGERKVVIISTVRSLYEDKVDSSINKFGFLYNEKRFNVAITRAKSLMIVIGNPHILWKDKRWNDLLRYCLELRAYTGCNLPLELDGVAKQLCEEMKAKESLLVVPTRPADVPTLTYNPDGDEDFDD